METERATTVEDPGTGRPETARSTKSLATPFGVDETAELVLDLLGHTALIAPDVLALVRGRAARGTPVTQALKGGRCDPDGVARMLAVRHHVQLVDLPSVGVAVDAAQLIPVYRRSSAPSQSPRA